MTVLLRAPERAAAAPVLGLSGRGRRTALWTSTGVVPYDELADRAAHVATQILGSTRRLVLVEGANRVESVVAYLAAVEHGHVALLVPDGRPDQLAAMVEAYDPDVVLRPGRPATAAAEPEATERREGSVHALHPELALLLSTSGSTGSPKLVRLSRHNVRSNAEAIAAYLRLTPADRAATSLPLHYCYGLSVLNSHLVAGGSLALTDLSVVDECFWDAFGAAGATSFAAVPYTFDLLDRSGFAERDLPTLRYVTQAGGRLAPERVRAYAELGRRRGWELFVMYGQTEATARMAYLPPTLAAERPESIGVPIPGGSFRLDPVPEAAEPGTGELVYTGPNVMMGYARSPADLTAGEEVTELRTGDLGRCRDGLLEVVGRRNRHAKLFGLRIDLDRVERHVARPDTPVHCVAHGETLHVFTTRRRSAAGLRADVADLCGLPSGAVRVTVVPELPLTAAGKPDRAALARQAELVDRSAGAAAPAVDDVDGAVTAEAVRDQLAVVLGRPDATVDDSFAGLGGDSLSYVELATRLSALLGQLPAGWHTRPARELAQLPADQPPADQPPADRRPTRTGARTRAGTDVDVTVALRALAIVAIVGTHANLFTLVGGAHLLLVVAGFNLARFQLAAVPRESRLRNGLASVAQVVVPSGLFIGAVGLTTGMYDASTALFLNGLLGSDGWTVQWQFWFLEALAWITLGVLALLAVPALDRLERRRPFGLPLALLVAALAARYAWTGITTGATERYTPALVLWFVVAGWALARAGDARRRALVVAVAGVGLVGYFGDPVRELTVLAGIALLAWSPTVRLPRPVAALLGVLAGASLSIYLTHWQVYPHLEHELPVAATLLSLAVGVAYSRLVRPLVRRLGTALRVSARS